MWHGKWKFSFHLVTKQSFYHSLNETSNQKTSFTKVAQFGVQFRMWYKKLKLSWHFVTFYAMHEIENSFKKVKFSIFYMTIDFCYILSVTRYLWFIICDSLSVTCNLLLDIRIFFSESCYYLQKLVTFARCCTSRNFFCNLWWIWSVHVASHTVYIRIHSGDQLYFQHFPICHLPAIRMPSLNWKPTDFLSKPNVTQLSSTQLKSTVKVTSLG